MDFATLKAQLDAARMFEVQLDGATFKLKLPTAHAWRVIFQKAINTDGKVIHALACHGLCEASVIGWAGVTVGHFRSEPATEPLEFSPDARRELLESRPDLADEMFTAISERFVASESKLEAERKNS